jgi:protein SCO1
MTAVNRDIFPPLFAAMLCGLVVALWACTPTTPARPRLNGAALEPAVALPSMSFTRTDGATWRSADARGRLSLFYFGYTHCPDMCPTTLAEFTRMRQTLGRSAEQVDMYFVTLDLARDTPPRMQAYVANFPGVIGLTGSEADLAAAQASFHVVSARREIANGDYLLDHTAAIYLVNRDSQVALAYPYGTDANDVLADVRQLIDSR